jgi:hypothetical protein
MFIYKSPRSGNTANIESITKGKEELGKPLRVNWQGGGSWYCTPGNLEGNVVNEANLTDVSDDVFNEALSRVLGGEEQAREAIAATTSAEVDEEEDKR